MTKLFGWTALVGGLTAAAGTLLWAALAMSRQGGRVTVTVASPRRRRA